MNIIMTGEMGLIGTSLKKRLINEGHDIIMGCDLRNNKNILDMKDMKINEKIDMVVHLAAHCKINQAIKNPENSHVNDANGTFAVLEFCIKNGVKKFVNFSSSRVLSPEKNPYTAAKIYGEELCKGYKDAYDIDYIIIRPSTVYGPFWDITRRLMHIFITNALENKDLKIYGNPNIKTLDFTFVDDFIDGTMLAINNPEWNKEYNISGNEECKLIDLGNMIISEIGSTSNIVIKDAETAQPQKVSLDTSAITKLGYSPKVKLIDGVKRNIRFCIDNNLK